MSIYWWDLVRGVVIGLAIFFAQVWERVSERRRVKDREEALRTFWVMHDAAQKNGMRYSLSMKGRPSRVLEELSKEGLMEEVPPTPTYFPEDNKGSGKAYSLTPKGAILAKTLYMIEGM